MNAKVEIKGGVGIAVNAEEGAAIHFHIHMTPSLVENKPDPELKCAIHILQSICEKANCQEEIEKISQTLFGCSYFNELSLEQLTQLQVIAEVLQAKVQKDESHTIFTQEVNEHEDFHRRIGVRASRLERVALTELMTTHPINPKQINLAWSNSILVYEDNQLRIKLPTLELWSGIAVAAVSGLELYLIAMQIVLDKSPIQQLAHQALTGLVFALAFMGSARYMIKPAFIGKRIRAAIEKA